jgi:hypothetical protein
MPLCRPSIFKNIIPTIYTNGVTISVFVQKYIAFKHTDAIIMPALVKSILSKKLNKCRNNVYMKIFSNITYLVLYANIMFRKTLGTIINYLEVKSEKNDKIIFLSFCTNLLLHKQNYIAVIKCVKTLWKRKTVSINYLLSMILISIT